MSAADRPTRVNRLLLAFSGTVLLAGGAFALLTGLGVLTVLDPASRVVAVTGGPVSWWAHPAVVAVIAVVLGLACLRWLAMQLPHRPRAGSWNLTTDPARGHTTIDTDIAVLPLEHDIRSLPGVSAATASLTGGASHPTLDLRVDTEPGTDLGELRSMIEDSALPRLSETLALPVLPVTVRFRLGTSAPHPSARVDAGLPSE
ncbi:hypothetical protein JOF53_001416 [Crossiella equi]|uniref:Alkaline shock response membrane anchor protein AmaP n=1 Tax=Crossiella equi TaxID=130796 RepID=A0ABS5A7H7_9PSEU|nr:hypothetical protein [Crossiella equi]MBP2472544.1 hypothetical protein [Crossiella equi]